MAAGVKETKKDKIIVFVGDKYGIFHLAEFALLVGLKLKDIPKGFGTKEDVFKKYNIRSP